MTPKITKQPESLRKYCGEEAVLTVAAEGPGTIRYQWQKNGENIVNGKMYDGATNHILTMNPLQPKHANQYSCIIENEHGATVSKQANLTLKIKITEQTQTRSAHFSEEVILYVSATGQERLEYQWKKDGKVIDDGDKCSYGGTDTNKLKITSMSNKLQGTYQCVVSNDVDEVESDEISLTMKREQRKLGMIIKYLYSCYSNKDLLSLSKKKKGCKKVRKFDDVMPKTSASGIATPGPTRAQALVEFVCALVKLLNSQA